ncbi:hypothetical protein Tsubulata_030025 [Turnera subulata]|uniref:KIB1-4 beta-propeller domain-containing protein n=1 Tax=Turnera subulata TaxID=218843 RepID=A0A9Q0G3K2_9ROSI|nr:hypothetical protein Tsubulata_030025 [Turnera subulata]
MMVEDVEFDDQFLLNVISRERIQLPNVGDFDSNCWAFLSPTDPNCHIVFFGDEGILFCKPGDNEYQRQDQFAKRLSNISSVGGKIYGIIGRVVHAFEFEKSRLELKPILEGSWLSYPTPLHIGCNYAKFYMIRSQYDDELLIVEKQAIGLFGFEVSHFGVYKANFTRGKGWIKTNDMGTRTIFLDNYRYEGVCCSTTDPAIKKNTIYYLNDDNKYIYLWDLEEESVTMHLPSLDVSQQSSFLYWIILPGSVHKLA